MVYKKKICKICKDLFEPKSGAQTICFNRECKLSARRELEKRYYHNIEAYRVRAKKTSRRFAIKRRNEIKVWIEEYKKSRSCETCGFKDYRCLDFHHRDPRKKEFSIGRVGSMKSSFSTIILEIEKCKLICSNCHRIEHYDERGVVGK